MKKLIVGFLFVVGMSVAGSAMAAEALTCWFPPGFKEVQAKAITDALTANSGITIIPKVAKSYPEILDAFATNRPNLAYAGSFAQSIISARKLGTPMVQSADGKEMYSGILICSKNQDPENLLKQFPQQIAFAKGASSGESTAKAATGGKAAISVASHGDAVKAVVDGKAQAAVVKDWWWLNNEKNYSNLKSYRIPGLSEQRNPDNVLTASNAVSQQVVEKLTLAAMVSSASFGEKSVILPFSSGQLAFSLGLMKKGGIDPLVYAW
jgi:ABC-type phosphate/phosphonate transport system substrate-binding protein